MAFIYTWGSSIPLVIQEAHLKYFKNLPMVRTHTRTPLYCQAGSENDFPRHIVL